MNDDTIDLHDAAKILNVGVQYFERLPDDGTLDAQRHSRRMRLNEPFGAMPRT